MCSEALWRRYGLHGFIVTTWMLLCAVVVDSLASGAFQPLRLHAQTAPVPSVFPEPTQQEKGIISGTIPPVLRKAALVRTSRRIDPSATGSPISLVSNAERLSIRFPGHTTLTGEYNIGGDETISLPVIGRLDVRGLTFAGLEDLLAAEAFRLTGRDSPVTIDVLDYREVFVTGIIARAGAHRWKRGMTVWHAEALSGGLFRQVGANGSTMVTEFERTRARRAGADLVRLYALQARLMAEREDRDIIELPKLSSLTNPTDARAALGAQEAVLQSRRLSFQAQSAALKRVRDIAATELGAIRSQRSKLEGMLQSRQTTTASMRDLKRRGIVSNERVSAEETRVLDLEERVGNMAVSVSRLAGAVAGADRDLEVLATERKAFIETELQRVDREIAQMEIEVEAANQIVRALTGGDPNGPDGQRQAPETILYEIVRTEDGATKRIGAVHSTELQPGDLLVVGTRREAL